MLYWRKNLKPNLLFLSLSHSIFSAWVDLARKSRLLGLSGWIPLLNQEGVAGALHYIGWSFA